MTLTTGAAPPAGIYWTAAIFAQLVLAIEPEIRTNNVPTAAMTLSVTPAIQMLPPVHFTVQVSPFVKTGAQSSSTGGDFTLRVSPRIGTTPSTAIKMQITPSISMAGQGIIRVTGRQVNATIVRAANY